MSLSGRPVYDPNPLRPNPNPKKPVSGSCRVHGLGRTLTPLAFGEFQEYYIFVELCYFIFVKLCYFEFGLKCIHFFWSVKNLFLDECYIFVELYYFECELKT